MLRNTSKDIRRILIQVDSYLTKEQEVDQSQLQAFAREQMIVKEELDRVFQDFKSGTTIVTETNDDYLYDGLDHMARKYLLEATWERFKGEKPAFQYKAGPLDYTNPDRVF